MADALTIEQQQALAIASAKLRMQQATPAPAPAQALPQFPIPEPYVAPNKGLRNPRTGLPDTRRLDKFAQAVGFAGGQGIEMAGPATGQAIGAMTGPAAPVLVPVLGGLGGLAADYGAQKLEMATNPGQKFKIGRNLGAGFVGMIPGGSLATMPERSVMYEAGKMGLGNMGADYIQHWVDDKRAPVPAELGFSGGLGAIGGAAHSALGERAQMTGMDQIYSGLREATAALKGDGIKVPPPFLGRGNKIISGMSGKAASAQSANLDNQQVAQKLGRRILDLPETKMPIGETEFSMARDALHAPYQEIKQLSMQGQRQLAQINAGNTGQHNLNIALATPGGKAALLNAAADVDKLRTTRIEERTAWDAYHENGDPVLRKEWQAKKQQVENLEDAIDTAAKAAGKPELLDQLRRNRTLLSMSHYLESATQGGLVNMNKLGLMLDRGAPFTGDLHKLANFGLQAKRVSRLATDVPAPGGDQMSTNQALGSFAEGDLPGGLAGAVQLTGGYFTRPAQLSEWQLGRNLRPNYEVPEPGMQDFMANVARYKSAEVGRAADPAAVQAGWDTATDLFTPLSDEEQKRREDLLKRQNQK